MKKERLDKLISSQSLMTRSEAVKLIKSGNVTVNGVTVKDGAFKVCPEDDEITVGGESFGYKKHIYIMLNKPAGVVSASRSPEDRTVIDLLNENLLRPGLFPAGRLDKDTVGFVLITDDGDFAHDILSPKKHISKTYLATLREKLSIESIEKMQNGTVIDGEKLLPADVSLIEDRENPVYEIVLRQGIYHQIKRMIAAAGGELLQLKRIQMGNLPLDSTLNEGEAREITDSELKLLRQL